MTKRLLRLFKILLIASPLFFMTTCLDPLAFTPRNDDNFLVIDGEITDNSGPQIVKLTRTAIVGRSALFPTEDGATVSVIENGTKTYFFNEVQPGEYHLEGFQGVPDNSYQLHIQLANGIEYESTPEVLPPPIPTDSIFFSFDSNKTISLFSKIYISDQFKKGPFVKWKVEHVYQITDLVCGPFDNALTCYFKTPHDNRQLPLLDGGAIARDVTITNPVANATLLLDNFGEITFFTVTQESISSNAFEYWSKVARLIQQNGSIFDAPPGGIRGNVFRIDKPDETVLGYFAAASRLVEHIKTYSSDFAPVIINPFCGVPGFPPIPFPKGCCHCTDITGASTEQPDYWH